MRRLDWMIASGFVLLGLLCLVIAGEIFVSDPMMGGMMGANPKSSALFSVILILFVVMVMVLLVRMNLDKKNAPSVRCLHCSQRLKPEWRVCPYCGQHRSKIWE
ncbi:zinc ribbon domain-containing protein [Ferroacidibacillus organovorans]|uniref:Zinc-ribbon domain-containing protein n=1 Tax=Ferroacidibacillus organovorans TaxID=1765683 RepID=A0A101XTH3_9BACL|nr:zinc ribbon domain-containing protein [Ferroacidibacillus organovorans]KUO97238.1 hypothetical protein ATW55_11625 [Ferroacidibacillus organovorans]